MVNGEPSGMRVAPRSIRGRSTATTPLRANPSAVAEGRSGERSSKYPVRRAAPVPNAVRNDRNNNDNNNNNSEHSPDVSAQRRRSVRRTDRRTVRNQNGGDGAVRRTVHWNDVELEASGDGANGGSSSGGGSGGPSRILGATNEPVVRRGRLSRGGVSRSPSIGDEASPTRPPLLLSWEALRYSVALPRAGRWINGSGGGDGSGSSSSGEATNDDTARNSATETGSKGQLLILDDVSGFAGAKRGRGPRDSNSEEAGHPSVSTAGVVEGNTELEEGGQEGWAGSVTAIMGPSGAGKTSLLNALAGRLQVVSGTGGGGFGLTGSVRLDGETVGAEQIRRVSAYVTQEDVLPETLTCYEHLMFHAHLRLPKGTPLSRRQCRVLEVGRGGGGDRCGVSVSQRDYLWGRRGDRGARGVRGGGHAHLAALSNKPNPLSWYVLLA